MDKPMKNMKVTQADVCASTDQALAGQASEYPYGLRICLTPEVMKKLDLPKLPEVGQMLGLHAVVEVVGVNIDRAYNGGRDKRVELQITDMVLQDKSNDSLNQVKESEADDEDDTLLGS